MLRSFANGTQRTKGREQERRREKERRKERSHGRGETRQSGGSGGSGGNGGREKKADGGKERGEWEGGRCLVWARQESERRTSN